MYLVNALLRELENPNLSLNDRAHVRCRLAKQLERAGDYEGAAEAMAELWLGIGSVPTIDGLEAETGAEVLLRVGILTGWIGDANQIEGSQEFAKDLISQSARAFADLGRTNKVGEARSDLAVWYWRAGAYDEARVMLDDAMTHFKTADIELRATALVRKAVVERSSAKLHDALVICNEAAPLFDDVADPLLAAHFHHIFANVLNQLSGTEHRGDYVDRALIEYAAASMFFEQAGHHRYQACVYINLGFLFFTLKRFTEAHEHLDRAQVLLTKLKDNLHLAQVDETRARVLLAEGRIVDAEKTVRASVKTLEKGENLSWLVEALITHGIALARLKHPTQARAVLVKAITIAVNAGDSQNAGMAALTMIEELSKHLATLELCQLIGHAESLLDKTQDSDTLRRLAKAAFQVLFSVQAAPVPPDWNNFSFKEAVRKFEANLLRKALRESGGSVSKAARLLGFKHHQSLISLLTTRHSKLVTERKPARKRRKHLLKHPKRNQKNN